MDTSDIEKQLMGSLKASEPTDPKDKEMYPSGQHTFLAPTPKAMMST